MKTIALLFLLTTATQAADDFAKLITSNKTGDVVKAVKAFNSSHRDQVSLLLREAQNAKTFKKAMLIDLMGLTRSPKTVQYLLDNIEFSYSIGTDDTRYGSNTCIAALASVGMPAAKKILGDFKACPKKHIPHRTLALELILGRDLALVALKAQHKKQADATTKAKVQEAISFVTGKAKYPF